MTYYSINDTVHWRYSYTSFIRMCSIKYRKKGYFSSKLWYFGTLIYFGQTMVLWKKLWYFGQTMVLRKNYGTLDKQWYYVKNYCTFDKITVLWKKLWHYSENHGTSIYDVKKHGRLPKTKKLWFIMKKNLWYTSEISDQIKSFRTLIYYGKLWYYAKKT